MFNRTLSGFCCVTLFAAANLLYAQDDMTVVSAAGAQSVVAPGALATVYGQFGAQPTIGQLNTLGQFPTQLAGFALTFNGVPAQMLFIGPDQINFIVPTATPNGPATLTVSGSNASIIPIQLNIWVLSHHNKWRWILQSAREAKHFQSPLPLR